MIRLGAMGFMFDLASFVAIPLGAWLFSFGYVQVFATSMFLYLISCSIGLARLWNFKEKIAKSDLAFKGNLVQWQISVAPKFHFYRFGVSQEHN